MLLATVLLAACGSDDASTSSSQASGVYPINRVPTSVASSSSTSSTPSNNVTPIQKSSDTVTLSWQAPTENADGTPLTNLQGYEIHYGASPSAYSSTIKVTNPGLTTYVVQNLPAGTYFFAVSAYNSTGTQSALSPEVSTIVD